MQSVTLRDIRFAARFLWRNRGFAFSSSAILALGIAMSTILFAVVKGALIAPWPYRGADRIVTVRGNYPVQGRSGFPLWSAPRSATCRSQASSRRSSRATRATSI